MTGFHTRPIIANTTRGAEDDEPEETSMSTGVKGSRILVAEDNPVDLLLVENMLSGLGVTFRTAEDGVSGCRCAGHLTCLGLSTPNMTASIPPAPAAQGRRSDCGRHSIRHLG